MNLAVRQAASLLKSTHLCIPALKEFVKSLASILVTRFPVPVELRGGAGAKV
jgi:hypothetical protein